jgi:hypothetical protein
MFQQGYGGGVSVGAIFSTYIGFSVECEYLQENVRMDSTFATSTLSKNVHMEFMNYMAGYYGTWKFLYAELGYYHGVGVFQWNETIAVNGVTTSNSVAPRSVDGLYYGTGCSLNIADDFKFKIGIRLEQSFSPAAVGQDKICPYMFMIRGGFEYDIPL